MKQVFGALLIVTGAWCAAPATAAPRITVRGHATLSLRSVEVQKGAATFVTRLRDAALRHGIPGASVWLSLAPPSGPPLQARARTDHRGEARFSLPARRGTYRLAMGYAGSSYYAATRYEPRLVDLSKATLRITARFKRALDASLPTQRVEVALLSADKPVAGTLFIDVNGVTIASAPVPASALELALDTRALGKPGPLRLRFRSPETPDFNSAQAELRGTLVTPVKLELTADGAQVPHDGTIDLHGRMRDVQGPVAGATVSLRAMGTHAASVVTDARGRFAVVLRARDFPPGPLDVQAVFKPAVAWRAKAESALLQVEVLPPQPLSVRAYVLSTLGTVLALLVLWAWRRRELFLSTRRAGQKQDVAPAHDEPPAAALEGGLVRARSRHLLRQELSISGTVWDPVDQRPLAGAQLAVRLASGDVQRSRADQQGIFTVSPLPPGRHRVEVSSPGYLSEAFSIDLPHRGQLHGIRVDLIAIRVRLLEVYRDAARPLLPKTALWGRWTPRELLRHLAEPPRSPFFELSALLEEVYWSAQRPEEEALRRAEELWGRIEARGHTLRS